MGFQPHRSHQCRHSGCTMLSEVPGPFCPVHRREAREREWVAKQVADKFPSAHSNTPDPSGSSYRQSTSSPRDSYPAQADSSVDDGDWSNAAGKTAKRSSVRNLAGSTHFMPAHVISPASTSRQQPDTAAQTGSHGRNPRHTDHATTSQSASYFASDSSAFSLRPRNDPALHDHASRTLQASFGIPSSSQPAFVGQSTRAFESDGYRSRTPVAQPPPAPEYAETSRRLALRELESVTSRAAASSMLSHARATTPHFRGGPSRPRQFRERTGDSIECAPDLQPTERPMSPRTMRELEAKAKRWLSKKQTEKQSATAKKSLQVDEASERRPGMRRSPRNHKTRNQDVGSVSETKKKTPPKKTPPPGSPPLSPHDASTFAAFGDDVSGLGSESLPFSQGTLPGGFYFLRGKSKTAAVGADQQQKKKKEGRLRKPRCSEEQRIRQLARFDQARLDAEIYSQEGAPSPPSEVARPPRRPSPKQASEDDSRLYLRLDARIHWPMHFSDEWYEDKMREIKARGSKKANWGQAAQRMRDRRLQDENEDRARREVLAANKDHPTPPSKPPSPSQGQAQPWSHDRPMDLGDMGESELPDYVTANAAWVRTCAWMRQNRETRADRSTRDKSPPQESSRKGAGQST